MAVRVSAYKNKKGKIGVSINMGPDEARELSAAKGDGVLGEIIEALREELNDSDSVAFQKPKKSKKAKDEE